jgi:hypothetical protein
MPLTVKNEFKKGPIKIPEKSISGEQLTLDLRKSELNKSSALGVCFKQISRNNKLILLKAGVK